MMLQLKNYTKIDSNTVQIYALYMHETEVQATENVGQYFSMKQIKNT